MNTQEIATRLAALCRQGQFETAQKELYAKDAISIEPYATPEFAKQTNGLEEIIAKGHKFNSMVEETHGVEISEPLVAANSFVMRMEMDMKMKGQQRGKMSELCLYKVKDGKIVSEEFVM